MAKLNVTNELLTAALAGYQAELERIDSKMGEIRRVLGDRANNTAVLSGTGERKRAKFSAATRRKMAAAQKARWAGIKKHSEPPQAPKPKKRKMSAAGKAAIVAAVKKRWAA